VNLTMLGPGRRVPQLAAGEPRVGLPEIAKAFMCLHERSSAC
jgi:hypothetical protein